MEPWVIEEALLRPAATLIGSALVPLGSARLVGALAPYRDLDARARLAPHDADCVGDRHVARAPPRDGEEAIAGLDPDAVGRPTREHAVHREPAVAHVDLDAHAAELALRVAREDAVLLGIHERAVRIERAHHPSDGAVDQLVLIGILDVHGLHVAERAGEDREVGIGRRDRLGRLRALDEPERQDGDQGAAERGGEVGERSPESPSGLVHRPSMEARGHACQRCAGRIPLTGPRPCG